MHWKKHKTLCNYLATAADQGGQENFYSGQQGKDRVQWNTFRMNLVKTCSVVLSRALSLVEQEMFLFPPRVPLGWLPLHNNIFRPAARLPHLLLLDLVLGHSQGGDGGATQHLVQGAQACQGGRSIRYQSSDISGILI
jgi:hypothetical protein